MAVTMEPPDCIVWAAVLLYTSCIVLLPDRLADAGAYLSGEVPQPVHGSAWVGSLTARDCGAVPD